MKQQEKRKANKGFAMVKRKVAREGKKASAVYKREQKDRQRRTEVRTHNFKLPGRHLLRFEEAFWKLMIARQCKSLKRRHNELAGVPLPHEGHIFLNQKVGDWLEKFDFEEPVASNSIWHRKRVDVIKQVASAGVKAAKDVAPEFIGLLVTFIVFLTGSDSFLQTLVSNMDLISWSCLETCSTKMNIAGVFSKVLAKVVENPFHRRYSPQKIYANEWAKAATGQNSFDVAEEQSSEEEEEQEKEVGEEGSDRRVRAALRAACFHKLLREKLPAIWLCQEVTEALGNCKKREKLQWKALQKMPGCRGSGYTAKNLALFLRETLPSCSKLGESYTPGGPGPKQAYNLQQGMLRKHVMQEGVIGNP